MARAEIITIGTELLLGQVLDTNSRFLGNELALLGIDCFFHSTVGDNEARIREVLRQALERSDIVLTSGGLGPTPDDLTVKSMADLFQVPLICDEDELARIRAYFEERGVTMAPNNAKQAYRPQGSSLLPNPVGTAPGIIWRLTPELLSRAGIRNAQLDAASMTDYKLPAILTFPGVPSELEVMWRETAMPYLREQFSLSTIYSVELKHFGIGESALAHKYEYLLEGGNPTVAPYSGKGECRLRVTAKAENAEKAQSLARPIVEQIKAQSGSLLYGFDSDTLESVVAKILIDEKLMLSLAESCTGGLLSKRLTDLPGSSAYTSLNLVTYSDQAKKEILGVDTSILDKHGAVSSQCALAMAGGVRALAGSDIGIGVTGIAGPGGGTSSKPVGLVFIGLCDSDGEELKELRFGSRITRDEIRYRTASEALNMLRLRLIARTG